jgi:hypothetical protein
MHGNGLIQSCGHFSFASRWSPRWGCSVLGALLPSRPRHRFPRRTRRYRRSRRARRGTRPADQILARGGGFSVAGRVALGLDPSVLLSDPSTGRVGCWCRLVGGPANRRIMHKVDAEAMATSTTRRTIVAGAFARMSTNSPSVVAASAWARSSRRSFSNGVSTCARRGARLIRSRHASGFRRLSAVTFTAPGIGLSSWKVRTIRRRRDQKMWSFSRRPKVSSIDSKRSLLCLICLVRM